MSSVDRFPSAPALLSRLRAPALLRRTALGSLIANVGIVVTGGAVRLTGSGLGCPTWPQCTAGSYVPTAELRIHGIIEFGNRTLTGVVGVIAVACLLAALCQRRRRKDRIRLAALVLAGIPAQAVIGGITVLTKLNPWVVACHFLVSAGMIAAAFQLWVRSLDRAPTPPTPRPVRSLAWLTIGVSGAVLAVGTVVTGSGPHAGDAGAKRTGLDPGLVAQVHADLVFLLVGLSIALWYALRAVAAPRAATRAALLLVGVELAQGLIGFVQYFTHLPALAVGAHLAGACLVWIATLAALNATGVGAAGVGAAGAGAAGATDRTDTPGTDTQGTDAPGTDAQGSDAQATATSKAAATSKTAAPRPAPESVSPLPAALARTRTD